MKLPIKKLLKSALIIRFGQQENNLEKLVSLENIKNPISLLFSLEINTHQPFWLKAVLFTTSLSDVKIAIMLRN